MSRKPLHVPAVDTHHLDGFQIQVMQPLMRRDGSERFPVLYITDANMAFDMAKGISHCLHVTGDVARYILVGIGYPGDNPLAGTIERRRDYTPAGRPEVADWPRTYPVEGVGEIPAGQPCWGRAGDFVAFIRERLMPFIDARYPTLPQDRGFFGHSLGGGFGLHVLFNHTALFGRYALSSPSISYDGDDYAIHEARAFIASGQRLDARIFLSVGGDEEFGAAYAKSQFVSSSYRLGAILNDMSGVSFRHRVYLGETHLGVYPIAFSHAVQYLYGPAPASPLA